MAPGPEDNNAGKSGGGNTEGQPKDAVVSVAATAGTPGATNTTAKPNSTNDSPDASTIAAIVLGAILFITIIAVVLFVLWRRRRSTKTSRREPYDRDQHSTVPVSADARNGNVYGDKSQPQSADQGLKELDIQIPQSADDGAITSKAQSFLTNIELFVENFYKEGSGKGQHQPQEAFAHIEAPHLPRAIPKLLAQSRTRLPIIKHVLAYNIVSRISIYSRANQTLFPDGFTLVPLSTNKRSSKTEGEHTQARKLSRYGRILTI